VIIIGIAIIVAGIFVWKKGLTKKILSEEIPTPTEIQSPAPSTASDETINWKTYKDEQTGAEFKYPESFGANVWRAYVWPPKLTIVQEEQDSLKVGCPDLPSNISSIPVEINGLDYIFYEASEGAAGSTYTTYCYITKKDKNYYVFNFLIRTTSGCGTNCGAYCETQFETECKNLDIVNTIDKPIEKIVSTFKF
jgi:hypothetical protein